MCMTHSHADKRQPRRREGNARRAHWRLDVRTDPRRRLLIFDARGKAVRARVRVAISRGVRRTAHGHERGSALEPAAAQRERALGAPHRYCRGHSSPARRSSCCPIWSGQLWHGRRQRSPRLPHRAAVSRSRAGAQAARKPCAPTRFDGATHCGTLRIGAASR